MGSDPAGRTAVVTGATGGMGRVIATELARAGASVVVVARTGEAGERLRREIAAAVGADRVEAETADLAVQAQVRALADRLLARDGGLHLLVNNAGAHFRRHSVGPDGV